MKKKSKVLFITFVSIFAFFWIASLVFLGLSSFSENITNSIQTWYSNSFDDKILNLRSVSIWSTVLSTIALILTLLAVEIKKRYR